MWKAIGWGGLALLMIACPISGCGDDGGPESDTEPPVIVETDPADGAVGVPANEPVIEVWFDERLNCNTVGQNHLFLVYNGEKHGSLLCDQTQQLITLQMSINLEPGAIYGATLLRGVCDQNENCTSQPYSWSFTVAD